MRIVPLLLAAGVLSVSLPAQIRNQNHYFRYDGTMDFTSRGGNGGSKGFVGQAFMTGFTGGLRTVTQIQYIMQDQNLATREPWNVGYTGVNAAGYPDWLANFKTYSTNNLLPLGSGIGAYRITQTPSTPVQVPAGCEAWIHTWELVQGANWTTDGLSVQMSFQTRTPNNSPSLLCQTAPYRSKRESPRGMTTTQEVNERLGWSAQSGAPTKPVTMNRSWLLRHSFNELVLSGAQDNLTYNNSPCPNPNEGYAGLDPEFNDEANGTPVRFDNYVWLVRAGTSYSSGVAVVLSSLATLPGGNGVPTPFGFLFLNPVDPLFAIGAVGVAKLDGSGQGQVPLNLGPTNSPLRPIVATLPTWTSQAVVINATGGDTKLTNVFTFRPATAPKGFTATQVTKGAEVKVPRALGDSSFFIRNDGYGEVTVQFKLNTGQAIGPAAKVCGFTAVRYLPASPVPGNFHITSNKTNPTDILYRKNY